MLYTLLQLFPPTMVDRFLLLWFNTSHPWWRTFFLCASTLPTHDLSSYVLQNFPPMTFLLMCFKTSHPWPFFLCASALPTHDLSSYVLQNFPPMTFLLMCFKTSHPWPFFLCASALPIHDGRQFFPSYVTCSERNNPTSCHLKYQPDLRISAGKQPWLESALVN